MSSTRTMDSLIANEFAIEVNGEAVSGIFGVQNFISYQTDDDGNRVKPPFEIHKMVERDANSAFNAWLRETLAQRDSTDKVTRDVTLVAVDDGVETRRWAVKSASIKEVRYTEFDSSSFEMIAEIFVIIYDDIEESFPASE